MLPDFPKLKGEYRKGLLRHMEESVAEKAPLAGRIGVVRQWEGSDSTHEDSSGVIRHAKSEKLSTEFSIPKNLPPGKSIEETLKSLNAAAEDMAKQTETTLFTALEEVTSETGNVLDAGGKPFEPSMLLQMLDTVWIDFDKNGKPQLPTIVLHPELFKTIKERFPDLDSDQEFLARRAEILAKKKEEWRDRESNRKLVG